MTRAVETAEAITEHLPGIPVEKCDMLREGAPYPPEPPVGHWKPEQYVRTTVYAFLLTAYWKAEVRCNN